MRTSFIRSAFGRPGRLLAVFAVALLFGCGDLPEAPTNDQRIAVIQITGCGAVAEGESCPITARAWNADGEEITNPGFIWSSTSPSVARVEGTVGDFELVGVRAGQATIRASDATRTVVDEHAVRVSSPSQGPPDGGPRP